MTPPFHHSLQDLAQDAVAALLGQRPLTVIHPAGWQRDGFPLPCR